MWNCVSSISYLPLLLLLHGKARFDMGNSATRGLEENVCHCGDFIIPSAG